MTNSNPKVIHNERWTLEVWHPFPSAVLLRCKGFMDIDSATPSREPWLRVMAAGHRLNAFVHMIDIQGIATGLRRSQGLWFIANRARIESIQVVFNASPISASAVGFVSRLLNDTLVKVHRDEAAFLGALGQLAAKKGYSYVPSLPQAEQRITPP